MSVLKNRRIIVPFLFAITVALIVLILTKVFFQNTTYRVLFNGFFSHNTVVTINSVSSDGKLAPLDIFTINGSAEPKIQSHGSRALNVPLNRVQIDFDFDDDSSDMNDAEIHLTNIQIQKPYQDNYYYSEDYIGKNFSSEQQFSDSGRSYRYDPVTKRISVRSKHTIGETNWVLILGLSSIFFIGVFFLARNSVILQLPAFSDMSLGNHISSSGEFDTINGLRGLAALLVLLSHTAPGFASVQMGLALLFVISGFLLSKPFVLDPQKITRWPNIERYITKRLKRILPMYYVYIFLIYVVTFKFDIALRHFFFVQAEGHLWPMTQIFTFYMMLPLILLLTSYTYKFHRGLPIAILAIASFLSISYMDGWEPFYNGEYSHKFLLYAFLIGILISYIQYDLIGQVGTKTLTARWSRELISIIALLVTFYTIAWSAPLTPPAIFIHLIHQFWVKCALAATIILLALNTPKTVYRLLISNWLFRSVGVIGFSFYILHGLGMQIFEQLQVQYLGGAAAGERSWSFMLGTFCVTYVMSVISYSYIERPFFGYREQK